MSLNFNNNRILYKEPIETYVIRCQLLLMTAFPRGLNLNIFEIQNQSYVRYTEDLKCHYSYWHHEELCGMKGLKDVPVDMESFNSLQLYFDELKKSSLGSR